MRARQIFNKLVAAVASLLVIALLAGLLGPVIPAVGKAHRASAVTQLTRPLLTGQPSSETTGDTGRSGRGGAGELDAWDAARLVDRVGPGLVDIEAEQPDGAVSAGSGIVLTADGLVLTNFHVIAAGTGTGTAQTVRVTSLGSGRVYPARVVGVDREHDLAVLALRGASTLSVPVFGDSDRVEVGDQVASIGNAYGDGGQPSIGTGPVTGLGYSITTTSDGAALRGLIKARTHIVPGESGGAMVNAAGEVIGVNVAYAAECDRCGPNGAGYAIPINQALRIARRLAEDA